MKFSVCIPNFNYGDYIGRTIQSVIDQRDDDVEIVVSDNKSTDDSITVIKAFNDERIRVHINECNVGFAANLDKAASMATGDVMILLSSDDVMLPGALAAYRRIYESLNDADAARAVVCSAVNLIDADDVVTERRGIDPELFEQRDLTRDVPSPERASVYRVAGDDLLKRSIKEMSNPFHFCATAYPRALYRQVEGYGGSRQYGPDKWFHWRLLGAGGVAYFVDHPLFGYRWHSQNQAAGEAGTGTLKFLSDEYLTSYSVDPDTLKRLALTQEDVQRAFIERDIAEHGLTTLATGNTLKASRIRHFGLATYPKLCRSSPKFWALGGLLALGPVGRLAATVAHRVRSKGR
jgi:glycosyltransferase involved in cell wall biosynthesis